jgi:signal-transduction protein with cAMP-binding, CBS, and nucleotidyltransferase domain
VQDDGRVGSKRLRGRARRIKNEPGDNAMLVEKLLSAARERLVTISDDAPLILAPKLLRTGVDLVIVCCSAGLLAGTITKTDIVSQISQCQRASCITAAPLVMALEVFVCRTGDWRSDILMLIGLVLVL